MNKLPPDQPVRDRIATDLHTNLLVEAGAGSGKTTAMVRRMIELIRTGTATVDQIAAVTFTRKAAAELRERFQEELESGFHAANAREDETAKKLLGAALEGMAGCFIGTIHAFCGRLLRERPIEAGIPPGFEELTASEERTLRAESFARFVERIGKKKGSRLAAKLADLGVRSSQLRDLYRELSENPDVLYPAERVPRPSSVEVAAVRERYQKLLDESLALMPKDEPEGDWDKLQTKIRGIDYTRFYPGWTTDARVIDAVYLAVKSKNEVTQYKWGETKEQKAGAKALCERWNEFTAMDGAARGLHNQWLAHRYPHLIRFAGAAARFYAAERRRLGRLSFQDLLMLTGRVLREHPEVRSALGARFRYLLVDEFQDTDPIQAEVLFLLASDPSQGTSWTEVAPRWGALFVVGDPKQSIYRFRRADIALYGQVKARFREIGDVVELTTNFRSTPPIADFVNAAFQGPLPEEQSAHQAAFAPLEAHRETKQNAGVYWHLFEPLAGSGQFSGPRVSEPDAERLASWIADRIATDKRRPGDFMILTRTKKQLAVYAKALEGRDVAVQASGTGVGVEDELRELLIILRALSDPGDPVLTVAALEGLFVGLSHQDLYDHVRLDGTFSFLNENQPEGSPAAGALQMLRGFWLLTRSAPADVAIPTIVEQLGVLPYAAAGELGATRAGALLYAMDVIRVAALDGATSLVDAVEILENGLTIDDEEKEGRLEADAPLFPGDSNAVRLMNLHKAKGLEADVVILACPTSSREFEIDRHIRREADGRALGFLRILDATALGREVLACPLDWAVHEEAERPFVQAEETRLRYVAATRARDELLVSRCSRTEGGAFWSPLAPSLDNPDLASRIEPRVVPPGSGKPLTESAAVIATRIATLVERRDSLARPSFASGSVTRRVKADATFAGTGSIEGRGIDWGRAAHRALELSLQGLSGDELLEACRTILIGEDRPTDDQGEPMELHELIELVESMRLSDLWARSRAAAQVLAEVPFHIYFGANEAKEQELLGAGAGEALPQSVEGVIDLAFREPGGWVIADYKTDHFASAEARAARIAVYRRQVDLYALCWERITGEPVGERALVFTHDGTHEIWS